MFFFTDTPTTAIYTLSLHDALPIFAGEVEVLLDEDHGHPEARVDADQLAQDLIHDGRDRKSTRLNSSHPSTSYAVFCLKKKNADGDLVQAIRTGLLNASRGTSSTRQ